MPEISTYTYSLREVAEVLLKTSNITEGKWAIGVSFGMNVGTMGPTQLEAKPGVMALVEGIVLTKTENNAEPVGLIIDAAKL